MPFTLPKSRKTLVALLLFPALLLGLINVAPAHAVFDPFTQAPGSGGGGCDPSPGGSFFEFPTWYEYLQGESVDGVCRPYLAKPTDAWLIVAAVFDIILRAAGLVAVLFVIWGAIMYISSQGQPDRIAGARNIISNALIGLVVAILSARLIGFIAGRFSGGSGAFLLPNVAADQGAVATALSVVFQLAGAIAVAFVAWGGITYARSNGDPGTIKQAKDTVIYAIVGLVIAIIGQGIVVLVVNRLT